MYNVVSLFWGKGLADCILYCSTKPVLIRSMAEHLVDLSCSSCIELWYFCKSLSDVGDSTHHVLQKCSFLQHFLRSHRGQPPLRFIIDLFRLTKTWGMVVRSVIYNLE